MTSFRKLSTGWEYRISYKDSGGNYRRKAGKGYRTKVEATQAAAKMEIALLHPEELAKEISLADFVEQWAEIYKKPHVTMRTWAKYETEIRNVRKYFGDLPISKITRIKYQQVFNEMSTQFAQQTLKNLHQPIKSAVKVAIRDHVLKEDFTDGAVIKSSVDSMPVSHKFLEQDEYLHVIEATECRLETPSYFLIYFISVTGMRFAEALGVTWDDIDFNSKVLHVRKSWDWQFTHDFKPTKNKSSVRDIPLSDKTCKLLLEYQSNSWKNDKTNRVAVEVSSNGANKVLRKLVGRQVHLHSLRHTYASYLIAQGVDLMSISRVLGHKDLTITLEVYAHQLDSLKEKSHDEVRNIFNKI
ncbi:MAG: site-specific integrase [Streptococcaceae bacterium]|jgi:integrase|nr:site-specific integrase [Streptococcaceae bacterium]